MKVPENKTIWPEAEKFLHKVPDNGLGYPLSVEEYGVRVKELRLKRGYTLTRLGKKVHRSYECIRKIENGIPKFINRELVPQFAKHLKCSCSYLLGYTDLINGFWYDPQTVLQMPITPYRSEEINANTAMIRGITVTLACISSVFVP